MPLPKDEALRIGEKLHYKDAIERIRTGNHKDGGDPQKVDTDILLISMLTEGKIDAILLPDGELCFFEADGSGAPR